QRRLARPARADDGQERCVGFAGPAEFGRGARDVGVPAEENPGVVRFERLQSAERGFPELAVPDRALEQDALALQPLLEAQLDLVLKILGIVERDVAGGIVSLLSLGPSPDDRLQQVVLALLLLDRRRLVKHRRTFAAEKDIRHSVALSA